MIRQLIVSAVILAFMAGAAAIFFNQTPNNFALTYMVR